MVGSGGLRCSSMTQAGVGVGSGGLEGCRLDDAGLGRVWAQGGAGSTMQGWGGCGLGHTRDAGFKMAGLGRLEGVQARQCRAGEGAGLGGLETAGSRQCWLDNVQGGRGCMLGHARDAGLEMAGLGMLKRVWAR